MPDVSRKFDPHVFSHAGSIFLMASITFLCCLPVSSAISSWRHCLIILQISSRYLRSVSSKVFSFSLSISSTATTVDACLVLCGAGGSDAAGYQDLSEGIAAQTVSAVDAARHLACGIEAGDGLAAGVEHMALLIDHKTAHGMMGGWCQHADG